MRYSSEDFKKYYEMLDQYLYSYGYYPYYDILLAEEHFAEQYGFDMTNKSFYIRTYEGWRKVI